MTDKLNSMRLLEQHKIPYEVVPYSDELHDAEAIAEVLGVPPHLVYKTLVVLPDMAAPKPVLVMLAAHQTLDLKRLAAAAGEKKMKMAAHKEAEALTGLKVGGISALALTHKNWKVFLDRAAADQEHILISAGQRGLDLRVPTASLITLLRARLADVSRPPDA
jgi:Cys-tRNA(Pro)/Cys-tRNA(Cys) deacylase